jgi:alkaline phosphatase D
MQIKEPSVGPIAGATTDTMSRIFIRGELELRADTAVDTYFKRYRDAFTTECIRSLMARVPTYMTLDDHEIEDNWPSKANERDFVLKFPAAIHAYQTYQLSHSPLLPVKNGKLDGTPDFLFYSFRDGCVDFFIADTRTERSLRPDRRQIIGPRQWEALTRWLADGSGRVKVIATAVPPFAATGDDKWEGFVEQRDHLLDFILANRVPRVVFISGDVHASFTARLRARTDPAFQVLSVVSSSFFWPYPHPPRGSSRPKARFVRSRRTAISSSPAPRCTPRITSRA